MLDPCLPPAPGAEESLIGGKAILGSTAGVSGMELGGLEPPTSWVRFKRAHVLWRSAAFRSRSLREAEWLRARARRRCVPVLLDSCLTPASAPRGKRPDASRGPSY